MGDHLGPDEMVGIGGVEGAAMRAEGGRCRRPAAEAGVGAHNNSLRV
jgi:hypothetical protein